MLLLSSCHSVLIKPNEETFAFGKDEVTVTGFTFPTETTKNSDNIHKITISRHWTSGNRGKWPLRDKKQITQFLQLSQLTACRAFPGCFTRRKNSGRAQWTPWVEETELRIQKNPRQLDFTGQSTREARSWESISQVWKIPLNIQQSTDHMSEHTCVRKLAKTSEISTRKMRENSAQYSCRTGNSTCFH